MWSLGPCAETRVPKWPFFRVPTSHRVVVSIGLFWFYSVSFLCNGVCFLWFIYSLRGLSCLRKNMEHTLWIMSNYLISFGSNLPFHVAHLCREIWQPSCFWKLWYFGTLVLALRLSPFWYLLVGNRSHKVLLSRCNDFSLFLDWIFIKYWWSLNWLGVWGDGEKKSWYSLWRAKNKKEIKVKNKTTFIHHFWEPTQSTKISALNI